MGLLEDYDIDLKIKDGVLTTTVKTLGLQFELRLDKKMFKENPSRDSLVEILARTVSKFMHDVNIEDADIERPFEDVRPTEEELRQARERVNAED